MPSDYHDFFPGNRRKLTVSDYRPLLDENGLQRFKLTLLSALAGQAELRTSVCRYSGSPSGVLPIMKSKMRLYSTICNAV
jgi:hypothetical protein